MNARQTYEKLLETVELPEFFRLEGRTQQPEIQDPEAEAYREVTACLATVPWTPGSTVAVTAGSREVYAFARILKGVLRALTEKGAKPFIVPAMGSHGGATAEGQRKVLAHYGITEESMGVPIRSCMDTVEIGRTRDGHPVHMDRVASQADYILPIGRIKAHTDFRGKAESGIMKMMAIGLGKQYGASLCHKLGFPRMGESVWSFGNVILENAHILLGLGVVENAEHRTAKIEAMPAERIPIREPELLEYAKSLMPKVPLDALDVLLVQEMGKDISGAGMDPNVTGRSCTLGEFWPHAEKIAVFDLTEASDGNAAGIGNADAITRRLFNKLDTAPMYINSITCRDTAGVRIPTVMDTDELAAKYLLYTCIRRNSLPEPRMIWMKNTADVRVLYASRALWKEAEGLHNYQIASEPFRVPIDRDGRMMFQEQGR